MWARYPLVIGTRRGVRFRLDLRDNVQRTLYFTGWYERRYVALLLANARRGDTFIDVGAHIGVHTLLMARRLMELGGGRVVAFEAAPDTAAVLMQVAQANGLDNVIVVPLGLGEHDETIELHSDPKGFDEADAAVRSRVGPGPVVASGEVTSFDKWRGQNRIEHVDLVKVDVEGDELAVLRGMRQTLREDRPRLVGAEIRGYILDRVNETSDEVLAELAASGYEREPTLDLEGNFLFRPASL